MKYRRGHEAAPTGRTAAAAQTIMPSTAPKSRSESTFGAPSLGHLDAGGDNGEGSRSLLVRRAPGRRATSMGNGSDPWQNLDAH